MFYSFSFGYYEFLNPELLILLPYYFRRGFRFSYSYTVNENCEFSLTEVFFFVYVNKNITIVNFANSLP